MSSRKVLAIQARKRRPKREKQPKNVTWLRAGCGPAGRGACARAARRLPRPRAAGDLMDGLGMSPTCQPPASASLAADRRPGSRSWRAAPRPQSAAAAPSFLPRFLPN
uniref:Uncharacterized protein n=1 Tax=Equus asinus asinus TaxID=83772 RepID=A0A8C4PRX2_EQUAS